MVNAAPLSGDATSMRRTTCGQAHDIFSILFIPKNQFMKTTINKQRPLAFCEGSGVYAFHISPAILSPIMKTLTGFLLFFLAAFNMQAQTPCNTYIKEVFGAGTTEPRIFKDASGANYFMTAYDASSNLTYITGLDGAGTILWTQTINIPGDFGVITDMIVDPIDGTLAAVLRGGNRNYIFKYDYTSASFNWIKAYPNNYIFQNIHFVTPVNYVVTGEILGSQTTIFQVNRATGAMGYQRAGFVGEFFSTFDGNDIYGACRYYSGSLFHPSLYRYNAGTGTNTWTNTYVENTPTNTCRIYPVAPVVDGNNVMQLSSGDGTGFNTYTTGPTDAWLLETDLAGTLAWTNHITIPTYPSLNAKKIINTATGYYLLIDSYNGTMVDYFFVIKTDKAGNPLWCNRYGINGLNTVISGVEDNGYLFLTALSGSYTPGSNILLLKLDPTTGLTDANCGYIKNIKPLIQSYTNTQAAKGITTNPTAYTNNPTNAVVGGTNTAERIYCATTCQTLPCNTLTGSLASGVLAFYPFGYGSLLDLSGNGNNLTNTTSAVPSMDRNSNPNCAYFFDRTNPDFLSTTSAAFLNNITTSAFSVSLWYQPIGPRGVGDYELLLGRGNPGLSCPDTWGEWSIGLYDCRRAVVGFDQYSHWEGPGPNGCAADMAALTGWWHHLAFVYDGATQYDLYIDGVLYSTSSGPCGSLSGNIGQLVLGYDYTGDLDDIVIYNRAITAAEVTALMGLNGSCCDGVSSSSKHSEATDETKDGKLGKGIPQALNSEGISVYPNPTNGMVSVSGGQSIVRSVAVYNNTGAVAATYTFDKANVSVNMEHLVPGVYFIKVITDAGSKVEKLIKN
jgi:hypothetical protein